MCVRFYIGWEKKSTFICGWMLGQRIYLAKIDTNLLFGKSILSCDIKKVKGIRFELCGTLGWADVKQKRMSILLKRLLSQLTGFISPTVFPQENFLQSKSNHIKYMIRDAWQARLDVDGIHIEFNNTRPE